MKAGITARESGFDRRSRLRTALVVEDDPSVLKVLCLMLNRLGFETIHAVEPVAGEQLFHENRNHLTLAIIDLQLPGRNGMWLLEQIRSTDSGAGVVMITGGEPSGLSRQCEAMGGDYFMTKPFSFRDLAAVVARVMGGRGRSQEGTSVDALEAGTQLPLF